MILGACVIIFIMPFFFHHRSLKQNAIPSAVATIVVTILSSSIDLIKIFGYSCERTQTTKKLKTGRTPETLPELRSRKLLRGNNLLICTIIMKI